MDIPDASEIQLVQSFELNTGSLRDLACFQYLGGQRLRFFDQLALTPENLAMAFHTKLISAAVVDFIFGGF